MRNISEAGLAKLASRYGNEPITIIEVDWVDGSTAVYADRTIGDIPGRIVEVGELDDAVNLSGSSGSQSLAVTLDDTDGSIKAILDSQDVHKRPARVYQYFSGLALSDRFLLFSGVLMTPLSWSERARTVEITIVSQLEDQECGFTTDENFGGEIPNTIPNQAWPLIFGTVSDNKAVNIQPPVTGTTLDPIGVLGGEELMIASPDDPGLDFLLSYYKAQSQLAFIQTLIDKFNCDPNNSQYTKLRAGYQKQYHDLNIQLERRIIEWEAAQQLTRNLRQAKIDQARLQGYGTNPVQILGGENFPQGAVTANITGAVFEGTMEGNLLTISGRRSDYLEEVAQGILNTVTNGLTLVPKPVVYTEPNLDGTVSIVTLYGVDGGKVSDTWTWTAQIPDGNGGLKSYTTDPVTYTITRNKNFDNTQPILQQMWIDAGASVQIYGAASLVYGVSLVPGTVTAVKALCTVSGVQLLRDVTDYTVGSMACGRFTGVTVTLPQRLSTIANEHWSDELYVSFQSAVGPSVVDVLRYIVTNFSDLTCDPVSFGSCAAPSPANFAINSSRNVLQVLQDIAFQACCSLRIVNGVVYINYLPAKPPSVDTITESDLDADAGIEVEITTTEELVTKMTVNWSELPVPEIELVNEKVWTPPVFSNRVITGDNTTEVKHPSYVLLLRNNVERYGMHEATYNFTIFNDRATVESCARFWLMRKSHSWKRVKFTTALHKLKLETFDAVTLDFAQPYVSNGPVLAIVESARYDSANNCIHFTCLTPVLAGTMEDCGFFWSE